ncbi:MAG: hypothetical protein FJ098_14670 [Deltaproteobacteria bacterium]|nr:hypothetical protein [Deltaproteobacteria bacterium]
MDGTGMESLLAEPREVAWRIQPGDVVITSCGATLPYAFLDALGERGDLHGVTIYSALTLEPTRWMVRQYRGVREEQKRSPGLRFLSFGLGPADREAWAHGLTDLVPVGSRYIRDLFLRSGHSFNVIAVGSSGMDEDGNFNVGPGVDWTLDLLSAAEEGDALVVVEVNPRLPFTHGETSFRRELVDHVIVADRPPPELLPGREHPEDRLIARHVADLVPDEATLAVGHGGLVDRVVRGLSRKRNLGVFSDLIGDALLHLHQEGALTNRRKGFMDGRWVGTHVMGTRALYEFVHHNPAIHLAPVEFVTEGANLLRHERLVAISGAAEIDLYGQVAGDASGFRQLSGPGAQAIFHQAASRSRDGAGIVVLRSTRAGGRTSTISTSLRPGSTVSIPRSDVDCIITENGVARLRGCSMRERALALISVAHPDHQDRLAREASEQGLL